MEFVLEQKQLKSGIHLHVVPASTFKTNTTVFLIRWPLNKKTATKNALLAGVLKAASNSYQNRFQIAKKTEEMYGAIFDASIVKKGEEQIIQFYIEFLDDSYVEGESLFSQIIAFLAEMVFNPFTQQGGFSPEIVAREKEILKQTIQDRISNKNDYAKNKLIEIMCKDEPFGIFGDGYTEDLDAINETNLREHYDMLIHESCMDLFLCGNFTLNSIVSVIENSFSFVRNKRLEMPLPLYSYPVEKTQTFEESMDLAQSRLLMGLRAGICPTGPDFYALLVMNGVLGGSSESKLFRTVREANSLCYSISSTLYRAKSIILIQSGIETEQYQKAYDLILNSIEDIQKGDFDVKTVESAVNTLVKQFQGMSDHPQALLDFYVTQALLQDNFTPADAIQKIEAITPEDIVKASKNLQLDTVYFLKGDSHGA